MYDGILLCTATFKMISQNNRFNQIFNPNPTITNKYGIKSQNIFLYYYVKSHTSLLYQ